MSEPNTIQSESTPLAVPTGAGAPALERRISETGEDLLGAFGALVDATPDLAPGPQAFARKVGIDKVLASRLLKAVRSPDAMSAIHRIPGPDPLRRVLRAMGRLGVEPALLQSAVRAVDRFDRLIRDELGDRGSLDAVISAWVPEARREFELRRKQAAFRAISQLKGLEAQTLMAAVFLRPSADGERIDVVWVNGVFSLHRIRPGVSVKFATRRMTQPGGARQPRTLDGREIDGPGSALLPKFCSSPTPRLEVQPVGEVVHYTLGGDGFGPRSAVDIVFAEANRSEIAMHAPAGSNRKRYVFAEVSTPARVMQFDAFVHDDVFAGADPTLRIYDTAFEGVADVNNPARDMDQMDMLETIEPMGRGLARRGSSDVRRYAELVSEAIRRLEWDESRFRGYRCRIDYPIYGSQVAMVFDVRGRASDIVIPG